MTSQQDSSITVRRNAVAVICPVVKRTKFYLPRGFLRVLFLNIMTQMISQLKLLNVLHLTGLLDEILCIYQTPKKAKYYLLNVPHLATCLDAAPRIDLIRKKILNRNRTIIRCASPRFERSYDRYQAKGEGRTHTAEKSLLNPVHQNRYEAPSDPCLAFFEKAIEK